VDKPYRVGVAGVLVMVWDESLHGILAQEMLESGRFIVTTDNGEPGDFFRKPPLGLCSSPRRTGPRATRPSPCACPPLSARSSVSGCSRRSRDLPVQFRSENRLHVI